MIASSFKSARRSSCSTKKLRQIGVAKRQGRLRMRKFKRGVRQRLRRGYRGRRRKLIELLNRPPGQLLAGLSNDLNKLLNLPKGVRSTASRPLQKVTLRKRAIVRSTAVGEPQGAVAAAPAIQS
jgi:hypothetical protein